MGIVIRSGKKVLVRKDNFQIVLDKKEITPDKVVDRKVLTIILYSEIDFAEFYKKHIQKDSNDEEYTVLVRNRYDIPTEN